MFFDWILEDPDQKRIVFREKKNYLNLRFLAVFFMDTAPDFLDPIRIFWPIRIPVSGGKSLIRIRTKEPGSETLVTQVRTN